jgi:hypothetical protein
VKQSIPHSAVTLYSDCVKMCEDFASNFGDKRINWLLLHDNAPSHISFFIRDYRHSPTFMFSVSPIEDNTERPQL